MYPVGALRAVLPDELVEDDVRLDPIKPPLALYLVAVDAEVSSLAVHVLAVADTAHGCVEPRASVAATYLYLVSHRIAERLQYVMNEGAEVHHLLRARHIRYSIGLRCRAGRELFEGEVLTDSSCHISEELRIKNLLQSDSIFNFQFTVFNISFWRYGYALAVGTF